jgi:predicted O-methyltransferase YrrM
VEVIIASGDAALAFTQEYLTEDEPLRAARASAADLGGSVPLSPAGGAAIRFLAAAIGARTVVEIGTGCGTSGIWLLRGMRPGAVLTSVDVEPEHQRMARKAFGQAGFAANQSRLIVGRALDVLPRLSDGAYDMVRCGPSGVPRVPGRRAAAAAGGRHRRL